MGGEMAKGSALGKGRRSFTSFRMTMGGRNGLGSALALKVGEGKEILHLVQDDN